MIVELFDQSSRKAVARYGAFLDALTGIQSEAADAAGAGDMRALTAVRERATGIAETFIDTETELYRQDLYGIQQEAEVQAQGDVNGYAVSQEVPWDPTGDEITDWYLHEVGAQVWRDINSVTHATRSMGLAGNSLFKFKDRAGRSYDSAFHVGQVARHGAVIFGVTMYAVSAGSMDISTFKVTHPVADHPHNGMPVDITTLPEIAPTVFHPNSRAFLEPA